MKVQVSAFTATVASCQASKSNTAPAFLLCQPVSTSASALETLSTARPTTRPSGPPGNILSICHATKEDTEQQPKEDESRRTFFNKALQRTGVATTFGMMINIDEMTPTHGLHCKCSNCSIPQQPPQTQPQFYTHGVGCACSSCFQKSVASFRPSFSYGPPPAMAATASEIGSGEAPADLSADYYAQLKQ